MLRYLVTILAPSSPHSAEQCSMAACCVGRRVRPACHRDPEHPSTQENTMRNGDALLYSIQDTVTQTGLSRTKLYEELTAGRLRSVKVGRRRMVPAVALEAWIESLDDAGPRTAQ